MTHSVNGKTVIVTGGSKGIGKGIARVFARHGANVAIVARNLDAAEASAAEIRAGGGKAKAFAGDVKDRKQMEEMARNVADEFGGIDILCANAGIFPAAALEEMTEEKWDEVLDTNVKGTFLAVRACLPYLKQAEYGRIVITSSITGPITGMPGWTHYAASKAAQLGFMRTAALELAKHNITVNAVLPGNVLTEGLEGMGEEYLRAMTAAIPVGKLGDVEDIGYAALFLASKEAGYITGQTLVVDGGQTLPEDLQAK
jgi:3-oxoacyl-[acyl-carrier protein] reductase